MAFKRLGKLIPQHLKSAGIARGVQAARVIDVANNALDSVFGTGTSASDARAVSLKHGKLEVASMHSAFRQEIHLQSDTIIRKINTELGDDLVKRIQVIV